VELAKSACVVTYDFDFDDVHVHPQAGQWDHKETEFNVTAGEAVLDQKNWALIEGSGS